MEEFKFTASDFINKGHVAGSDFYEFLANVANAKLKEYLDKCPTVYMIKAEGYRDIWSDKHVPGIDTHECKLFNIKTITEEK